MTVFPDDHVEWDAGGFRWRMWQNGASEKVGRSTSQTSASTAADKTFMDYMQEPSLSNLRNWVRNLSSSRAANASSGGVSTQPIKCRIVSIKQGDLLNVR